MAGLTGRTQKYSSRPLARELAASRVALENRVEEEEERERGDSILRRDERRSLVPENSSPLRAIKRRVASIVNRLVFLIAADKSGRDVSSVRIKRVSAVPPGSERNVDCWFHRGPQRSVQYSISKRDVMQHEITVRRSGEI